MARAPAAVLGEDQVELDNLILVDLEIHRQFHHHKEILVEMKHIPDQTVVEEVEVVVEQELLEVLEEVA